MKATKIFLVILFFSGLTSIKAYSQTEFANVEDVYNLIKGNWYQVIECDGQTGKCKSVINDYLLQIERIPETDSISWSGLLNGTVLGTVKLKIEFAQSYLTKTNGWMLTGIMPHLLISKTLDGFHISEDAYDGGGAGFAREKLSTVNNNSLQNDINLSLFPNPTSGSFMVKGVENVKEIKVLASNGNLIQRKDGSNLSPAIDISTLSKGIYFVQVITKSGTYTGKIIKN